MEIKMYIDRDTFEDLLPLALGRVNEKYYKNSDPPPHMSWADVCMDQVIREWVFDEMSQIIKEKLNRKSEEE